jgi:hypothetical protein
MAACNARASSSIAAKVASVTAPSTVISCSWMIAARSSSLITPLAYWSNGDMAESTSSIFSIALVASSICCRFSASRTLEPSGTTTTTCAVTPPAWGKVRFRESSAACDSVPGTVNFSSNLPPSAPAAARAIASTANQISSTRTRRR